MSVQEKISSIATHEKSTQVTTEELRAMIAFLREKLSSDSYYTDLSSPDELKKEDLIKWYKELVILFRFIADFFTMEYARLVGTRINTQYNGSGVEHIFGLTDFLHLEADLTEDPTLTRVFGVKLDTVSRIVKSLLIPLLDGLLGTPSEQLREIINKKINYVISLRGEETAGEFRAYMKQFQ